MPYLYVQVYHVLGWAGHFHVMNRKSYSIVESEESLTWHSGGVYPFDLTLLGAISATYKKPSALYCIPFLCLPYMLFKIDSVCSSNNKHWANPRGGQSKAQTSYST